ncbi:MAG: hypothetical protein H6704_02390 [Myxococcales bacterium]|nr:hypothetical protein [Myxococcales bacterium]
MAPTVPARFEHLLSEDPFAAAVVLERGGAPDRVWNRAAIEHRATVIGGLCAALGLGATAPVAVRVRSAVDCIAAVHFVLASGRSLAAEAEGAFVIDDHLLGRMGAQRHPYTLCTAVGPADRALEGAAPWSHARLLSALGSGVPVPVAPAVGRALGVLVSGKAWRVQGRAAADGRSASAA